MAFSILSYFRGQPRSEQPPEPRAGHTTTTSPGGRAVLKRTEPTRPLIGENPRGRFVIWEGNTVLTQQRKQ